MKEYNRKVVQKHIRGKVVELKQCKRKECWGIITLRGCFEGISIEVGIRVWKSLVGEEIDENRLIGIHHEDGEGRIERWELGSQNKLSECKGLLEFI